MDEQRKRDTQILHESLDNFMQMATAEEATVLAGLIDLQVRKLAHCRRTMRQGENPEFLAAWKKEHIDDYGRLVESNARALDQWYQFETQGGQVRH